MPEPITDEQQGELWPELTLDDEKGPKEGRYTGERLAKKHPRVYQAIVKLLAAQRPITQIARCLGVSVKTVMMVRDREGVLIAMERESLAQLFADAGRLSIELAREKLAEMFEQAQTKPEEGVPEKLKDLLVAAGISIQNMQLLSGEPTHRIEQMRQGDPEREDYERFLEAQEVEAEVLEQREDGKDEATDTGAGDPQEVHGVHVPELPEHTAVRDEGVRSLAVEDGQEAQTGDGGSEGGGNPGTGTANAC